MKVYAVRCTMNSVHIIDVPFTWHNGTNQWVYGKDKTKCSVFSPYTSGYEDLYQYLLTLVPNVEEPVEIEL